MLAVLRDGDQLVPVPLLIENYQDNTGSAVNEGERTIQSCYCVLHSTSP